MVTVKGTESEATGDITVNAKSFMSLIASQVSHVMFDVAFYGCG